MTVGWGTESQRGQVTVQATSSRAEASLEAASLHIKLNPTHQLSGSQWVSFSVGGER